MIAAAMIALALANSQLSEWYFAFINSPLELNIAGHNFAAKLSYFVNDVLMVLFFFLIGMELKREAIVGVLADRKQILLPLFAAIGGMVAPALVFMAININHPQHWNGWAISSATDIAFAICILTMIGKAIPPSLKIFLLAIAIFDDLGAILIIALFYNNQLALAPLAAACAIGGILFLLGYLRVKFITIYLLAMAGLWFFLHEGGIHTTLAGVITGLAIPLKSRSVDNNYSPLAVAMHFLHPWISFMILPLFAFTAAGVDLRAVGIEALLLPLPLSIAAGLFFGKQLGIFTASWLTVKLGFADLPENSSWRHIYGISVIAGIGFTMSLFIGMLAFSDLHLQEQAKIGVISGSLLASIWGWTVMRWKS